jgi:hypothetical protein
MNARVLLVAAGSLALLGTSASSVSNCPAHRVSEIESPLGCVNTVVTKSFAPTDVYVGPGDSPVARVGAHVRVCLLSVPRKGNGCDPATDIRGREFLVYNPNGDSGENAAVYTNAEHLCGGA